MLKEDHGAVRELRLRTTPRQTADRPRLLGMQNMHKTLYRIPVES